MIEFKDVAFQYEQGSSKGKIENINLTIHDGEVVLICGESGCGKTTLTRLINGLIPHYYEGTLTGQTIVEGIDVKNVSLYALSGVVGSVFQNPKTQFFNVDTTSEIVFGCGTSSVLPDGYCRSRSIYAGRANKRKPFHLRLQKEIYRRIARAGS